jgi:hypothetical protein
MESQGARTTIDRSQAEDAVVPTVGARRNTIELTLEGQQLEFHRVLSERSREAPDWYLGALIARSTVNNPERFVQASQSVRELMKHLHRFFGIPIAADETRLGDKFSALSHRWEKSRAATACHSDGVWDGPIDRPLRWALITVDETIDWHRSNRQTRRTTSIALLTELDVSRRPLPPSLEDAYYEKWSALHDYFVTTAHHGRSTNEAEFDENLNTLERLILDLVAPKTSAEQELIDKLVEEAERDA